MKHREHVQSALEAIAKAHQGKLLPQDVVKEAKKNNNSPLHRHFDWDVNIAANKHWLEQARDLIKTYYTPVVVQQTEVVVPYWQSEEESNGKRHYSAIIEIISDKDRRYANAVAALAQARDVLRHCPHPTTQRLATELERERVALTK